MSILIKGLEIPQGCYDCEGQLCGTFCEYAREYITHKKDRHPNCPLVEIPTPHGRLIEKLEKKLYEYIDPFEVQGALKAFYDAMDGFTKGE